MRLTKGCKGLAGAGYMSGKLENAFMNHGHVLSLQPRVSES